MIGLRIATSRAVATCDHKLFSLLSFFATNESDYVNLLDGTIELVVESIN